MCMIELADGRVTIIHQITRKARKPHTCGECYRTIEVGEYYEDFFGKYDGLLYKEITCSHCTVPREWLRRECGGWLFGAIKEDLREHWYEDGIRTVELGRLIKGMDRQWRTKKGNLMKVPKLEPVKV